MKKIIVILALAGFILGLSMIARQPDTSETDGASATIPTTVEVIE